MNDELGPTLLYELMPLIYRQRDLAEGEPLRALFAALQSTFDRLHDLIDSGYDDLFIETCSEAMFAKFADLVAVPDALTDRIGSGDTRSLLASVLTYRRAKGTLRALDAVASDATGWTVRSYEGIRHVLRTHNVLVPELSESRTFDVRRTRAADALGTPFDRSAHAIDVRLPSANASAGGFASADLGVAVWRLGPEIRSDVDAAARGAECYTFDPLGNDVPLVNPPIDRGLEPYERTVPEPLRADAVRDAFARNGEDLRRWPLFAVRVRSNDGTWSAFAPSRTAIADLRHWRRPAGVDDKLVVDPQMGRFLLPRGCEPAATRASCAVASSGPTGAGGVARSADDMAVDWEAFVARDSEPGGVIFASLESALDALDAWPGGGTARITIADSGTYPIAADRRISLDRFDVRIAATPQERPVVVGDLSVSAASARAFSLHGLVVRGSLLIRGEIRCEFVDTTLVPVPDVPSIVRGDQRGAISVVLERSVSGSIRGLRGGDVFVARRSIVDGAGGAAIGETGDGCAAILAQSTLFGNVTAGEAAVTDSIVAGALVVARRDRGMVHQSAVRDLSRAPRDRQGVVSERVRWLSRTFARPGYAVLSTRNPETVLRGAMDGGELGAFNPVATGKKIVHLRDVLREYAPATLNVGTYYDG